MKAEMKILFPTVQGAGKKGTTAMLCMVFVGLVAIKVKAQEWFPVGAKWTYSVFYPSDHNIKYGIGHMECTKDTIIEGITAKVLVGGNHCAISYGENIFYYNDTVDILYYYVAGTFRPYFDFSKKAGESYYMYYLSPNSFYVPYDSLLIEVLSVSTEPFAGINVRSQSIFGRSQYYSQYSFSGTVIEYVGNLGSMFPVDACCDMSVITELRCYSDNTFSYFSKPIYEEQGCDVNLSINEILNEEVFTIYPNPTSDKLKIENGELKITDIQVFDVVGKKIFYFSTINNTQATLNIESLHIGLYFIKNYNRRRYATDEENCERIEVEVN